jgi:mono/diheme cytochrome c family protein
MVLMKVKFVFPILIVGLLSACASQTAQTAASQPTEVVIPVPQVAAKAVAAVSTAAPATQNTPATSAANVSFTDDIMPIFESRCMNCHGQERLEEGLSLRTYSDMMAGSKNGAVVVPGNASNSLLAQLVSNQKMPKRGPKLTPPQVQLIIDWINQGAPDN